jgi:hypothetical protein
MVTSMYELDEVSRRRPPIRPAMSSILTMPVTNTDDVLGHRRLPPSDSPLEALL